MGEKGAVMEEKGAVTKEKRPTLNKKAPFSSEGRLHGQEGHHIWYQGRRHRQKWFRSGKRAPSRTRRASFFCRKDAKTDEKGAVMEGKGALSLT